MTNPDDDTTVAIRSRHLVASGALDDFREIYAPDCLNREAVSEPPASRGRGPEAFHATALYLRAAFPDLTFEIHETVQDHDLVVLHTTMRGHQTGTFVTYAADASVDMAFPPRNRPFAVHQSHWFRMRDGKIVEHWADRDDLAMSRQLGWTPPTPVYVTRMLRARRRARSAARRSARTAG